MPEKDPVPPGPKYMGTRERFMGDQLYVNQHAAKYCNIFKDVVYYHPTRDNSVFYKQTTSEAPITRDKRWGYITHATHAVREIIKDKIEAGPNPEFEMAKWNLKMNKVLEFDRDIMQLKKIKRTPLKYPMQHTTPYYHPGRDQLFLWDKTWPKPSIIEDESYRNQPYPEAY